MDMSARFRLAETRPLIRKKCSSKEICSLKVDRSIVIETRKRDWMTTTTTSHFISLNGAESSQPTSTSLAFFCPFIVGELF